MKLLIASLVITFGAFAQGVPQNGTFSTSAPTVCNPGTVYQTATALYWNAAGTGTTCTLYSPAGGSSAFSAITGSTNTTAAMLLGSGASLGVTGTGTNNATSIGGITVTGTPSVGWQPTATSSTAATWQAAPAGFSNPMTTLGDIITGGAGGTPVRSGLGATGTALGNSVGTIGYFSIATLAGISGAFVDTTSTQTVTGKTVDGVTPATFAFLDPTSSVQAQLNTKIANRTETAGAAGVTANLVASKDTSNPTLYQTSVLGACGSGVALTTAASGATFTMQSIAGAKYAFVADNAITAGHILVGSVTTAGRVADSGFTTRTSISKTACVVGTATANATTGSTVVAIYDGVGSFGTLDIRPIGVFFDGGGAVLTPLTRCTLVPYSFTIQSASLASDVAGSATVDVRTVAYASYTGPGSATSIAASAIPTLSSATKYQDVTLTGWTKVIAANTFVCFAMSGISTSTTLQAELSIAAN